MPATFGYPEIDVGLIPAIHFVQLPRLVGKHQAFGPLFLGDPFDAATAFRMGLLSEVVPKGTALARAREIARRLAAKSPIVMKIGRDAFMRAVDADSAARWRMRRRVLRLSPAPKIVRKASTPWSRSGRRNTPGADGRY